MDALRRKWERLVRWRSRRSPDVVVGVDFGAAQLKIVARPRRQVSRVDGTHAALPTPTDAMRGAEVADPGALAQALGELVDELDVRGGLAIIGLPGTMVQLRSVRLRADGGRGRDRALQHELERWPLDERRRWLVDAEIVGVEPASERFAAVLVAVDEDIVHRYLDVIVGAGLVPAAVDVDAIAFTRVAATTAVGGVEGFVDLGCTHVCASLRAQQEWSGPAALSIGSGAVSTGLAPHSMSVREPGLVDVVRHWLEEAAGEAQGAALEALWITGGGAYRAEVVESLGVLMGCHASILTPAQLLGNSDLDWGPEFSVAAALTQRRLRR